MLVKCEIFQIILLITLQSSFLNAKEITDEEYYRLPNVFHQDNYEECMFGFKKPLFCFIQFQLEPRNYRNVSETWRIMARLKQYPNYYHHDNLKHSICIPKVCPKIPQNVYQAGEGTNENLRKYIDECYSEKFSEYDLKGRVETMFCQDNEPLQQVDDVDKLVAISFGCLFIFIILATYFGKKLKYKIENAKTIREKTKWAIIYNFSLIKNFKSITTAKPGDLLPFEGLKTLLMLQIIILHGVLTQFASMISNTKSLEEAAPEYKAVGLLYSMALVQPFFMMSAFLYVQNFFKNTEGKIFSIQYIFKNIIRRYLRLIPTLLAVIALEATWLVHAGKGPNWHYINIRIRNNCRANAWINLLFLSNVINVEKMCNGQSWYLSADFQCFLLINIILGFIWKLNLNPRKTFTFTLISSVVIHFVYNYVNNIQMVFMTNPGVMFYTIFMGLVDFYFYYFSTIQHLSSYCIGALFGCVYYFNKKNNVVSNDNLIKIGFNLSVLMIFFVLMVGFTQYKYNIEIGRFWAALHGSFYRLSFALFAAMMLFCSMKNIFFRFLRWRPLASLGNISYSTYLLHCSMMLLQIIWNRTMIRIDLILQVRSVIADIVLSIIFGIFLVVAVELPFRSSLDLIMKETNSKESCNKTEKLQ